MGESAGYNDVVSGVLHGPLNFISAASPEKRATKVAKTGSMSTTESFSLTESLLRLEAVFYF